VRLSASSFFVLAAALAAVSASAVGGCQSGPPPLAVGGGDGSGAGADGGAGGGFVDSGKQLWAGIEAELVTACGACHDAGGIGDAPFLAGPDRYKSVLTWPGVVVVDPAESLFITYSVSGSGHNGTNLDTVSGDLLGRTKAWLAAEAASITTTPDDSPHVEPFTPILGFNAVYLTSIDPALNGVAITFTAEELTPTTLKLDGLTVHTTSMTGVHLIHPVFGVYPKGAPAEADPVDSFAGLDTYFPESTSLSLGSGTLILTNWAPEAKLGLAFETCAPWTENGGDGGGGGGITGGCNDVTSFDDNATPQLQQRCVSCHGGSNPQATAAVDMSDLATDSAAACAQVKNRVNLTTPANSQVFIVTDPGGNAAHPFKFNGDANAFNDFRNDLTVWIQAE
jgi:cytochrome c553